MGEGMLTTEQRVALAWLYAAAEQTSAPRVFTYKRYGCDTWARPAGQVSGPEYRLPGDTLDRLLAHGLAASVEPDRFALGADWPGWADVRDTFAPAEAAA